jgi:predicted GNAT family N-acyltransferase
MQAVISKILSPQGAKLRKKVFMDEQGFSYEFDEIDQNAWHLVLYENGMCIGVCRLFDAEEESTMHSGRIAVEKNFRKKGVGKDILKAAEYFARTKNKTCMVLDAQCRAKDFYEKAGYKAFGSIHDDEGCPHISMKKIIDPNETLPFPVRIFGT